MDGTDESCSCRSRVGVAVALLTLIAFAAALPTGCAPSVPLVASVPLVTSEPLPGPGNGTANVFIHPVTGEVVHCETTGLPYQVRGATLWRRSLTPHCSTAAEKQGFVRQEN